MRVLVIGSGGREHAMVHALNRSADSLDILCAPGNAGTQSIAENIDVSVDDGDALLSLARERGVGLTIVGPEAPLCAGIVDRFQGAGLRILGPSAEAARLEGDKSFSKQLMIDAGVPTARGRSFTNFKDARTFIATRDTPQVVKAAGLAAGKGVIVCDDPSDALLEAERMMIDGAFGDAGRQIVVEEKLIGEELSVHALVDGDTLYILETSQDHKRAGDGDTGPNTGGMGAYSPAPIATDAVMRTVEGQIIVPIIDALRRQDVMYRGVLYCGLMLTPAGPKALEFNCRFGDPEAQVLLSRLQTDFLELANACVDGKLESIDLSWDCRPAVCVVMASAGYPGRYEKGRVIDGISDAELMGDVTVYHAGTQLVDGRIVTNGGRVLGVTALGDTVKSARDRAYEAVDKIEFTGGFHRSDIGHRALSKVARLDA